MGDDISTRRATHDDLPAVIGVARASLGWNDADAGFLRWKHLGNPFGESPMWVAEAHDRIVGFRAFLRWRFRRADGTLVRAVRAVDTATVPEFQGRGIFTRLTLDALDELRDDGVDLVFNTPNASSLPGYLKMGWQELGRLPVVVRPNRWRFPLTVLTARRAAGRDAVPGSAGAPAEETFADREALESLLAAVPERLGLATDRTPELYAWRYGNPHLGYRVVHTGSFADGCAVYRLRRRGRAVEAVVCDVLAPRGDPQRTRELVAAVARERDADYLIRLGCDAVAVSGFVPVPRMGPVLTCRPLDGSTAPVLADWRLSMGDVELL
ncbi:MAG: GNAT family N-acetyltransferase [Acidimicrobiia bacterium]